MGDLKLSKKPPPSPSISPSWKRPEDVMRQRLLKLKKRTVQSRTQNASSLDAKVGKAGGNYTQSGFGEEPVAGKRKNPFRCSLSKRLCGDSTVIAPDVELSSDNTLFQLLNASAANECVNPHATSFTDFFSSEKQSTQVEPKKTTVGFSCPPVDWTLKSKARFVSKKAFTWSQKLKTSEEASGTTGFVRCLAVDAVDTSPNAQLHQCSLVWQHPSLPWVSLFPRFGVRGSASAALASVNPAMQAALNKEWCESFRSLFHLVRARQCPYFYLCAGSFTCLFRAAGISGIQELNAVITPTTRGLREAMKEEDVEYTMPLYSPSSKKWTPSDGNEGGYETADSGLGQSLLDDEEDEESWLQTMGVDTKKEIPSLSSVRVKIEQQKMEDVAKGPGSTVYVEGVDVQALFNFLLNCRSCVATTGPLAGVPPTLLAPNAFHGATLTPLKVRQGLVKIDAETYNSLELQGPILPHIIHNVCSLADRHLDNFSVTFTNMESSVPFSSVFADKGDGSVPVAFGKESLSDCGLPDVVLKRFCLSLKKSGLYQLEDSKSMLAELKYENGTYTWC